MALSPGRTQRALVVLLLVLSFAWWARRSPVPGPISRATAPAPAAAPSGSPADGNAALLDAAHPQRSHVQLFATGTVARLLPDDTEGSRHQRFLVRVADELTVLVAYNLDLAPHIPLVVGDSVTLRGEYIWNEKGGVLHWTHHDPARRHQPGWVDYRGTRYQ